MKIMTMVGASIKAIQSLPALNRPDGTIMSPECLPAALKGKRVALYFSAGWCPMCTSFEPSLLEFMNNNRKSNRDVEVIYVPSDKSSIEVVKRTSAMGMMHVPWGEDADAIKSRYGVWAGIECPRLGTDRRSGVPSLVVLDSTNGNEMAYLPTESMGARALDAWPLDDPDGVW